MADITQEITIEYIEPDGRIWDKGQYPVLFIDCHLASGGVASVGCSPNKEEEVRTSLEAIKGQPTVCTLEQKDDFQGKPQFKLKDWPGKPAGSGGGGGGGNRGGGGMTNAQAGYLMASHIVAAHVRADALQNTDIIVAETIRLGEEFTEALFSRRKPEGETTEGGGGEAAGAESPSVAPAPVVPAGEQITLPQMQKLKQLAEVKFGLGTVDEINAKIGVTIGSLSKVDADDLASLWESEPDHGGQTTTG